MTEKELEAQLAQAQKTIDDLVKARDVNNEHIKKAVAHRNDLENMKIVMAMPESPLRARLIGAIGVESQEVVGTQKR